jgi:hypothetical protein
MGAVLKGAPLSRAAPPAALSARLRHISCKTSM